MSSALSVVQPSQLQQTGGINFGSKLFQLFKPATITINQPNTQVEGAVRGKLRISETGQQFDTMRLVFLDEPQEARAYYQGEPGQLNRTQENLMCFSRDMIRPDRNAKMPQAINCEGCAKQDWSPYRKAKEDGATGQTLKNLIPPCDPYYYALFIDTVYKVPVQMFVRGKSTKPFEAGLENAARVATLMKAEGKSPNWYDIGFSMSTKLIKTGVFPSYVISISDVKAVSDEERAAFGEIYLRYVNSRQQHGSQTTEEKAKSEIDDAQNFIDGEIVQSTQEEITF